MANTTQPLAADQAQELAREFHDIASAIGDFRIEYATTLSTMDQYSLQNAQSQCLQYSNHFIAQSLFAQQADLNATLKTIKDGTAKAKKTIEKIDTVDKVLQIATAAAVLGASIVSLSPAAVGSGIEGLYEAIVAKPAEADAASSGGSSDAKTAANSGD